MSKRKAKKQGESVRNKQKKEKKKNFEIEFVFPNAKEDPNAETTATLTGETAKSGKIRARNRLTFRF